MLGAQGNVPWIWNWHGLGLAFVFHPGGGKGLSKRRGTKRREDSLRNTDSERESAHRVSVKIADKLQRVRSFGERLIPLGPGVVWFANPDLGTGLCFPISRLGYRAKISGPTSAVEAFMTYVNPTQDEQAAYFLFPLDRGIAPIKIRFRHGDVQLEAEFASTPSDADQVFHRDVMPPMLAKLFMHETERVLAVSLGRVRAGDQVDVQLLYAGYAYESAEDGRGLSFRIPLMASRALTSLSVSDADQLSLATGLERGASVVISLVLETSELQPGNLATSQVCGVMRQPNGDLAIENDRRRQLESRDFVLDYQLWSGPRPKAWLRTQGRHFLLSLYPPMLESPSLPRRIVFLVDGSDEMTAVGSARCYECIAGVLEGLGPKDTFALVTFNRDVAGFKSGDFVGANLRKEALQWLKDYHFTGVADLKALLERVVKLPVQVDSTLSIVLVAAGRLGNEPDLYQLLAGSRESLRFFSVLLGRKASAPFARAAAKFTGGKAYQALSADAVSRVSERLLEETRQPPIESVGIQDQGFGFQADSLTPRRPSGLSGFQALDVMGQHSGSGGLEVGGRASHGAVWSETVHPKEIFHRALPLAWAMVKASELDDEARMLDQAERRILKNMARSLAVDYALPSSFTSLFIHDPGGASTHLGACIEPSKWYRDIEVPAEGQRSATELLEEQRASKGIKGGRALTTTRGGLKIKETLGKGASTTVFGSKLGHQARLSGDVKAGLFHKPMFAQGRAGAEPVANRGARPLTVVSRDPSQVCSARPPTPPPASVQPTTSSGRLSGSQPAPPQRVESKQPHELAASPYAPEPTMELPALKPPVIEPSPLPSSATFPPSTAPVSPRHEPTVELQLSPTLPRIRGAEPLPTPQALAKMVTAAGMASPPEDVARQALREDPDFRQKLMQEMRVLHKALGDQSQDSSVSEMTDVVLRSLAEVAPQAKLLVQAYGLGYQARQLLADDLEAAKEKLRFWLGRFAKLF